MGATTHKLGIGGGVEIFDDSDANGTGVQGHENGDGRGTLPRAGEDLNLASRGKMATEGALRMGSARW
jgi:hypothetical protein